MVVKIELTDHKWFGEKVYSDIFMLSLLLKEGNARQRKLTDRTGNSMRAEARLWIWENSLEEYKMGRKGTH